MTTNEKIKIIEQTSLFQSLSHSDFLQIAEVAKEQVYEDDQVIFEENELADAFYIIATGSVEILKEGEDSADLKVLATKGAGEVFGELAIIDDLPRSATIRARGEVVLLKISKNVFLELMKNFSHIAIEIARNIAMTVRTTNSTYIINLEKRNKQLEYALKKLKSTQAELIRLEKLSVVGKFASLIIHDIKNPLSNIRAYAELIQMSVTENEKVQKSTGVIISEIDRLTLMTGELLEFSRGEINLSKTPINFAALMSTMIDTVREEFEQKEITIQFQEKTDTLVMIDAEKIKRVFINLISNARDALISGGLIIIKLVDEGKWVKWTIQDNGMGMPPEVVQKIFEPFFSYNKKKGTGLGMAIVKSIIDSHQGNIKVASKKDKGTRFDIFLPKA